MFAAAPWLHPGRWTIKSHLKVGYSHDEKLLSQVQSGGVQFAHL